MARVPGLVKHARLAFGKATLADLWDHLARAYGTRTVLTLEAPLGLAVLPGAKLRYDEVARAVARLAGGLRALGVTPGTRVAICTENRIDFALTLFAIVRAGGLAVPLHHHLTRGEVEAHVRRARAGVLVADPTVAVQLEGVHTVTAGPGGALDHASASAGPLEPVTLLPDAPAVILFTSGTTGAPKGATLTSRSLLAVSRLSALIPDAQIERGVCGLPLAHVMGLSTLLASALAGAQLHWLARFDAKRALERLTEQRASFFVGVPAMYAMLAAEEPERFDLSAVRLFVSGADVMPPALVERFKRLGSAFTVRGRRLTDAAFAEIYGMVELSGPAILKLHPPVPIAARPIAQTVRRAASFASGAAKRLGVRFAEAGAAETAAVGIPIPPFRARVVDEAGVPVRPFEVGELELRGAGVTRGYDADPEATARTTHDGWLRTGDLARQSRLGLIGFVTRKKDVIKSGGFSVFPAEVEAQLAAHSAIAEAVVFGLPHARKGEVPVAAVVLANGSRVTEQALLDWAHEHIAPFKAPRAIAIVASSDIPRNANRKVLKDALREKLRPRLAKQLASRKARAPR